MQIAEKIKLQTRVEYDNTNRRAIDLRLRVTIAQSIEKLCYNDT